MSKSLSIAQENFKKGLILLEDDTKAPLGSARKMLNVIISDRGGITTRPGTQMIGTFDATGNEVTGFYNFKKTLESEEYILRAKNGTLYFYHPTIADWAVLKTGFEVDADFGFTYSLVNTDNLEWCYFCNRFQDYQRWRGSVNLLNGALVGAETAITVDSTLKAAIYESKTASASAATTLDVTATPWAASMWIGFYVYITSGVHSGKVRLISANTSGQITFATLGSDPGLCTFEIRELNFPATGTLIYAGTTIAYTAVPTATTFTVASAHAAADNTPIAIVPEVLPAAPRGNRIESLLGRVIVGNVRSALSRDTGGTLTGSAQAGSVFVSKILNGSDFTFAATRIAGEGDIINMPYGGGPINDVKAQEEFLYVYKKNYIEAIKYSGDSNDIAVRQPLKTGIGATGRVVKGRDDHFFMTLDNQLTSIGRVKAKDIQPQTENIGMPIKRLLESYDHTDFDGYHFNNRVLTCHKSDDDNASNDVILVRNLETKSFEGVWSLPARFFDVYTDKLHFAESNGANVWEMFKSFKYDKRDSSISLPFTADWRSNFFNVLPLKSNIQGVNSIALEGYITGGTIMTFSLYKDFSDTPVLTFDFGGTEEDFLMGDSPADFLGANPLGLSPLGTVSSVDESGRRRFQMVVYFPYIYGQTFSTGLSSSGTAQDWEVERINLGLKESVSSLVPRIKTL